MPFLPGTLASCTNAPLSRLLGVTRSLGLPSLICYGLVGAERLLWPATAFPQAREGPVEAAVARLDPFRCLLEKLSAHKLDGGGTQNDFVDRVCRIRKSGDKHICVAHRYRRRRQGRCTMAKSHRRCVPRTCLVPSPRKPIDDWRIGFCDLIRNLWHTLHRNLLGEGHAVGRFEVLVNTLGCPRRDVLGLGQRDRIGRSGRRIGSHGGGPVNRCRIGRQLPNKSQGRFYQCERLASRRTASAAQRAPQSSSWTRCRSPSEKSGPCRIYHVFFFICSGYRKHGLITPVDAR